MTRVRAFHLGERAKELDSCASAYFEACEAWRQAHEDHQGGVRLSERRALAAKQLAARRLLAAARAFGRARVGHAIHNAETRVGICPGCNLPLESATYGRPRKYHSSACYNLARRLTR